MRKIITPLLLLIFCFSAYAQSGGKDWRQQIKAQKVAFITEQLSLTPKEAQKFWPIYNTYEDKLHQIRRNDERALRDAMKKENLTEKEAQDIIDQYLAIENKTHLAKQQLIKDLGNVITPQKIIKLKIAEDAFNRKLMESYRQRRAQRMKNKKP
ncbi:sensor of ECF-type sigma factor [Pontimicrobium aquaticum]|uniref:Sensor of ECF-type sigma factor n=1 Tax=Pontimicrobium aquaticum TaxID=2565367 RepID=A0A4U0F0H6_9FLAO|nr:sensor of ECF-type sigma factor [Pontimicrobium aquaticum]TJY36152.1 sensor of ECF-type sigma factor [Pontimicrobium aquaticum]